MTTDNEIRDALAAEASQYELPDDLAARTIDAAREAPDEHRRVPRWIFVGAAAAVLLVGMFFVGRNVGGPQRAFLNRGDEVGSSVGSKPLQKALPPQVTTELDASSSGAGTVAGGAPARAPFPQPAPNPGTVAPKIAKSADVEIRVRKGGFERAWRRAQDVAGKHSGFVTDSTTEMLRGRLARGSITIRVPADQLDAAIGDFRSLGTLVRQSTSGRDVAAQIVDFDARLRASRAQELQLLELMKQARSLSDTLEVRSRLDHVRQEIEQLQAQRDTIQGQVDYSTLTASVYEPDAEPSGEPVPLGRLGIAWHRALDGLINVAAGFVVVLGYALPLAAIVFAAWLIARAIRRRGA